MPLEFAERTIVQGLQASYIILVASYAGEGFIPVPAEKKILSPLMPPSHDDRHQAEQSVDDY